MHTKPLENQKWFNISISLLSMGITLVCWLIVRTHIPKEDQTAKIALLILFVGTTIGFSALFRLLLPLLLVKIWPKLEQ